jgi:signal transduction histidine kinase
MNPGRWQHIEDTFIEQGMLTKEISLKDFLYDANPKPDLRFLYGLLATFAIVAVGALVWVMPLLYLNRKRRLEIARRIVVEKELIAEKEKTEEVLAAQSRFLAVMSHEVRSPIGGISRLLQLIVDERRQHLPAEVHEDLCMLQQSAHSLFQLVDEVLEWSRCEADGVEVEITSILMKPFIEEIHALFRPLAGSKNLVFNYVIEPGVPEQILSDGLRLRQIISNLLANAIKFTDGGGVQLRVKRAPDAKADAPCQILFEVEDTGIGISPEGMKRLFKPYQQADPSIARKFGGSGLGLSISLHLAKLLGGDITVRTEVNRGSTFTLSILAQPLEAPATVQTETRSGAKR